MPERLAERVEQALADPDLLSLRHEIAVLDGRLGELLSQIDTASAAELWRQVTAAWQAVQSAPGESAALDALGMAIDAGGREAAMWRDIESTMDARRRLVESERRAEVEAQTTISVTQALTAITRLIGMVYDRIHEGHAGGWGPHKTIDAIRSDYARLIHHSSPQSTPADPDGHAGAAESGGP